jgi:hypothetical protein
MADESILEKAAALIPGVGSSRKKSSATQRHKQLQAIQRKLATLAKDVEKLAVHIADDARDAVTRKAPARKPAAKKPSSAKPAAAAKRPAGSAKKPAAISRKKPAAKKPAKAG